MLDSIKKWTKIVCMMAIYLFIVAIPFVFLYALRDDVLTMSVFGAFVGLYLLGNAFKWKRPRLWRFGSATTDMLVAGLFTFLVTGFKFKIALSVVAGIALADLTLTSVAFLLLHVASWLVCRELFGVIDAFKQNKDHFVFKIVEIVSLDIYETIQNITWEREMKD